MTLAVWGATPAVEQFVSRGLWGDDRGVGTCQGVGFADQDGRLVAGVLLHNWQPDAGVIEVTAYAETRRWLTKGRLREVFGDYIFGQLGCQMAVARIAEENRVARRFWAAMGADEFIIPRLRGRNEAEVIATLTVEAWQDFIDPKSRET